MCAKKKQKKHILFRLILLGASAYMLISLTGLLGELSESKKTLAELEAERDAQMLEIAELKELLEDGSHAAIIEKAARERLGYVYSNEEIYIDISGN